MNPTVILIEIIIMLLVFGILVFGMLYISPLTFISDYPPEIQEVYYRTQHKEAAKKKLTIAMKTKKIVALIAFLFLFAWMLHLAGAETFVEGLLLSYAYILCLFAWDTLFLDWVLFANMKRVRLPGTEHKVFPNMGHGTLAGEHPEQFSLEVQAAHRKSLEKEKR